MTKQLRLPGLDPSRQIRPDSARRNTVLWIRRLSILRELKLGAEHIVRTIELRPGLNILWAPPKSSQDGNALFQGAVAGHTAGKTTFCRLVRYILGERTFATEAARRRIREKFPSGWVVGEVLIGDKLWTTARPFGIGAHSFCVRGTLESALEEKSERHDLPALFEALKGAIIAQLPARRFPTSDEPLGWDHLLPWLSRDQECRFADVLEWRHSSSASESPALTVEERQFLVRSVLGLISDKEREEQRRNALLVSKKAEAGRLAPLLSYQASVDHGRVQELLGMPQLAPPSTGLFHSESIVEIQRRKADLEEGFATSDAQDRRAELQAGLEHAVAAETNARRNLEDTENRLAMERSALEQLTAQAKGDAQAAVFGSLPPARDYCNVPMNLARERECPLAMSRPINLAEKRSERNAAAELSALGDVVRSLEQQANERRMALAESEAATKDSRRALFQESSAYEAKRAQLVEEQAALTQAERLIRQAEQAWGRSVEQADESKKLTAEVERSYKLQEEFRNEGAGALSKFSSTFDYVARALLGDELEGRVDPSGRGLALTFHYHGDRESAALATVKLLAFDLAALTESVEGRGYFPRFLIHDGPREADMAPDIYERLFLYARQLEACFEGQPNFQYLVTTTAPPPKSLQVSPWLIQPVLDASTAEGRLLGVDL
jgi:hypothetical protein